MDERWTGLEIAIVGMSCRFPGASSAEELWRNLCAGVESISFFTAEEMAAAGADPAQLALPGHVRAGGEIAGVEGFDAGFFGYTPREAELMDPQHRMFLECCWEAFEAAGYDPGAIAGQVGVYAGTGAGHYLFSNILASAAGLRRIEEPDVIFGNEKDFLATRVAYKLGLEGPAVAVQSACSTSLLAVHLACQGLLSGACDMALAGGVSIGLPLKGGYRYVEGGKNSPDGHCRAFDAEARGLVPGKGVGVVVLKRLADALADGDDIAAVLLGSAATNDGSRRAGFSVPSMEGQARAIRDALLMAGVAPETIGYVEAHGTGTPLGDPIEIAALTKAFRAQTAARGFCAVGSVKTNIGHLDTAAGVAGLIKAALVLRHGQIPASLHFRTPNPNIDFAASPFYVNDRLMPWEPRGVPRRAGVSSFGLGGTNVHAVLEEPPLLPPRDQPASRSWQPLILSARTPSALRDAAARLARHLEERPGLPLPDVAYTLAMGRRVFEHRLSLVARDAADACAALHGLSPGRCAVSRGEVAGRPVAFLFPGGGAQYPGMGAELYADEPAFRAEVDRCAGLLAPRLGFDLRDHLYPAAERHAEATERMRAPDVALPALFVTEYALARLWMSWGIRPEAMLGHSLGEYTAACLAGVLGLEDALALVSLRGQLFSRLPAGAMLGVSLPEAAVADLLGTAVSVAAVNGPELCVVAGSAAAIAAAEQRLTAAGVDHRRLHIGVAAHSPAVEPVLEEFSRFVAGLTPRPPEVPYLSNVTGTWIQPGDLADPQYWTRHLRQPVRFSSALETLLAEPGRILLEVGPGRTLSALARQHPAHDPAQAVIHSLPHPQENRSALAAALETLGHLWRAGAPVDWQAFYAGERRRRVVLPTYPFERQRYWIAPDSPAVAARRTAPPAGRCGEVSDWFYVPVWREKPRPRPAALHGGDAAGWLVFADGTGVGEELAGRLAAGGERVVAVAAVAEGEDFARLDERRYRIDPERPEHYAALLEETGSVLGPRPRIVHLWSLTDGDAAFGETQRRGLYSLLLLTQAACGVWPARPLSVWVVGDGLCAVESADRLDPGKATLFAAVTVIPQELPHIGLRLLDLPRGPLPRRCLERLETQVRLWPDERVTAWRGDRIWTEELAPQGLPPAGRPAAGLRPQGVYLITGGLGGVGLVLAEHLARAVRARLVLVGRTGLPPREEWASWCAGHGEEDPASRRIRRIEGLESMGAEVLVIAADVAEAAQLEHAVGLARQRFGGLHGVIHAAGAVGEGTLRAVQETDRAACEAQFRPKVAGVLALERALAGEDPDFCLLCSSLSSVLGGLGHLAYAAANRFLDAFAASRRREGALPWISLAWEAWRLTEWTLDGPGPGGSLAALALAPAEGVEVFRRVVAGEAPPVLLVSTADLAQRFERWVGPEASAEPEMAAAGYARPELASGYVAPRHPVEERLVEIWRDVFGFDRIGVEDNFFELGGDSLLATRLMARVRAAFQLDVPLRQLFEEPTVGALAASIAAATGLAGGRQPEAAEAAALPVRARDPERPPLSFGQQRIWFLDRLFPGTRFYNVPVSVALAGELDVEAMAWSLGEVVRRHAVLRARFPERNGEAGQVIAPPRPLVLPTVDLAALAPEERPAALAFVLAEGVGRSFDLEAGPVFRFLLARLAPREHALLVCLHHIACDGESMSILVREVADLYAARHAGRPSPLPEPPAQYADHAAWQQERLRDEVLAGHLEYWRGQLGGDLPVLGLLTDLPRPPVPTFRGALHPFEVPGAAVRRLRRLALARRSSPFMTLLAVYLALLHRCTGQDDLIVGAPVANRDHPAIAGVIGFFANTLALRVSLAGEPTFGELLERVREVALGAYAHQELPFEKLVAELQPERNLSRTPVFQTLLVFQGGGPPIRRLPGLELRSLPAAPPASEFDLTLSLVDDGERLTGFLQYLLDLFHPATVARMARCFVALLEAAVAAPAVKVGELPILAEGERHQILAEWNDTAIHHGGPATLHALAAAQARSTPAATALVFEDRELSYGELDRRASLLAARLRTAGVGPEVRVGIFLERSLDLVVALLGVLKAGGAYLPLDPDDPPARRAYILADARVPVLVSDPRLRERGLEGDFEVLWLDGGMNDSGSAADGGAPAAVHPSHPAYVIYTSGTTGRPKGAVVSHAAIVNRLLWMQSAYRLAPEDRVLQKTAASFDVSVWELFWPLLTGSRLVLAAPGGHRDPAYLARLIQERGITTLHFVPSMLRAFLEEPAAGACRSLTRVIVSGEELPADLCADFHRKLAAGLFNLYGPTEAAVDVTAAPCPRQAGPVVAIGRPIDNLRIYLLDGRQEPVPIGVAGDLHIAGIGLARGYLFRPDLTAERFLPDPFGGTGERMYRTGDRARYLPEGSIQFLGRTDGQLKIRGFRIEPGEIEAALRAIPGVSEAVVVPRGAGSGQLIAYLVPAASPGSAASPGLPAASELARRLRREMPEHMVPGLFHILESLPRTASGKVDRRALPSPEPAPAGEGEPFAAPGNPVEELLAEIWQEVLGISRAGVHSSFFQVGGHSLLALQVLSRVRGRLGVELPLRQLFETPTISGLAGAVAEAMAAGNGVSRMPEVVRRPAGEEAELSFSQERLWFLSRLEPASPAYNIPILLRLEGPLDLAALAGGFAEVNRRHEILRTRLRAVEGKPRPEVLPPEARALPLVDLGGLPPAPARQEEQRIAAAEAAAPFDLESDLPLRVRLVRCGPGEHLLLSTVHHVAFDGWSERVLVEELSEAYRALSRGARPELPALPIQYADFAYWQRRYLTGETLERMLATWRARLALPLPVLALPTDFPRREAPASAGASCGFAVPPDLAAALRRLSHEQGCSLFMVLLAGFGSLLSRHCGQRDLLVGTHVAGRSRAEIEPLIGYFVNTLAMRIDLAGDPGARTLLARVREVVLEAFAVQDLPFELLLRELRPERDLNRTPVFQAVANFQSVPPLRRRTAGLALRPEVLDTHAAKFELALQLKEVSGEVFGALEYRLDLFTAETIGRLRGHLLNLLRGMTEHPERPVAELPLLTEGERRQLAAAPGPSVAGAALASSLGERFSRVASQGPDRTAVRCGGASWSYRDLEERANRIAHALRAGGGRLGDRAALLLGHDATMVAAVLGTLKAGLVYVPLDPAHPVERLAAILEDSGAVRLLVSGATAALGRTLVPQDIEVIDVEVIDVEELPADLPAGEPGWEVPPDSPAYILYTSGSTGRPKGVLQSHRNVLYHASTYAAALGLGPDDRLTLLSAYTFDAAVMDLFGALLSGASLHPLRLLDVPGIAAVRWLEEEGITVLHATPTVYRYLVAAAGGGPWPPLRFVVLGGEPALAGDLDRFRLGFPPGCTLVNGFGPTESTLGLQCFLAPGDREARAVLPVGRPVPGTGVLLLDEKGRDAEINGEIALRSPHVALGYWRRPELTAAAFVPDPQGHGRRMYRTGDLGRLLADGRLEFIGRRDLQVKIRGHRIELAEVEGALARHPAVAEAVVRVWGDGEEQSLAAYAVPAAGAAPRPEEVLRFARRGLPSFAVPGSLTILAALPVTTHGKVDRQALPAPVKAEPAGEPAASASGLELAIAEAWRRVLGIDRVGPANNFFDLGGHSLLLLRLHADLQETLGRELPVADLFRFPTVASLAAHLAAPAAEALASRSGERARLRRAALGGIERAAERRRKGNV